MPLGSDREVASDFQLIAGTVRDLRQWVAEGRFREDLYARQQKASSNDADRLRKYLARFGLDWAALKQEK